jgi:hypothetical protein
MTAFSSKVIASTGHTSTHAPQAMQVSSSTSAGMDGGIQHSFKTFS